VKRRWDTGGAGLGQTAPPMTRTAAMAGRR